MTDKRPISADDLFTLQLVGDPQISPDGRQIVFVRRTTDREKNKYVSQLWLVRTDGADKARRLTGGKANVGEPRWSPDGTQIAFTSDREDEQAQIFVLPVGGGEAQTLTKLEPGGARGLRWSPDGKRIAFSYRATPPASTKKATEERKEKGLSSPPRVHTQLGYRLDGFGYWDNSYWQAAVVDLETGDTKILTTGAFNCDAPVWSPDGQTLAFLSDRRDDWDARPDAHDDIFTIDAGGGALTLLASPPGDKGNLRWSPDGKTLAYTGNPDPLDSWGTRNSRVFILPSGGGETARDLTGHTDKTVGGLTLSDARDGGGDTLTFSENGQTLFFTVSERGDTRPYSVDIGGGEMTPLTPAGQEVGAWSVADSGIIALTLGDATHPHEVYALDGGEMMRLTGLNDDWLAQIELATPEPLTGDVPGWILTPPNFKPNDGIPFVVYIHGGPHAQYGNVFFHELQWLAANGYVVAYTNPRGSKGYGEAHTSAIKGDWGGPALEDVEKVIDDAIARGWATAGKLAVMGGSYGGYLTAWAVGHTDRFACAIADRLVNNIQSMAGTSDFPWRHGTYYKGDAWDDPSDLLKHSPQTYAAQINTPLLLVHSDGDLRCPVTQAEELFAALRLQKKPVEFVRYPAETSHGLSRNGPADLRLDRLKRNLAWLDKYLKSGDTP